jgi:predicted outer membrane protein
MKTFWAHAIACALTAAPLVGCGQTEATSPSHSNLSAFDLAFVTNLYNVAQYDYDLTQQELGHTSDPRVLALANDLLKDANALVAKVKPIADREGIVAPNSTRFGQRVDLQMRLAAITASSLGNFDVEYLDDEIESHEEAIQSADKMANVPGGNPELRTLAQEGRQILITNLARLKQLRGQMAT